MPEQETLIMSHIERERLKVWLLRTAPEIITPATFLGNPPRFMAAHL